jgi:hypothetical protein
MRLRLIFAILVGLALALAPLAMPMGQAMAGPASHSQSMGKAAHCPDAPKPSHHQQGDKNCCVAGCMALAALPAPTQEAAMLGQTRARPALDHFRRGYLGEIATPPPRAA